VPAAPLKSSLNTVVQPVGGAGAAWAEVGSVRTVMKAAIGSIADTAASTDRRRVCADLVIVAPVGKGVAE
jgi:hypothetical protein